jgi:hypothetical protein
MQQTKSPGLQEASWLSKEEALIFSTQSSLKPKDDDLLQLLDRQKRCVEPQLVI